MAHRHVSRLSAPLILGLVVLLASCAEVVKPPAEIEAGLAQAEALIAEGRLAEAAAVYAELARGSRPPQREQLQLRAAETVLAPDTLDLARKYLGGLADDALDETLRARRDVLSARIALLEQDPERALEMLPIVVDGLPPELQQQVLNTRADALLASGRLFEAIQLRVELDARLVEPEAVAANREALWAALAQADTIDLFRWSASLPFDALKGWLDLAYLARTTPPRLSALEEQLGRWQQAYPTHPAATTFLDQLRAQWQQYETYPDSIAVLLPLSGRYAAVADAILDGILAAYYRNEGRNQPTLRIFDVGDRAADIWTVYTRAVLAGATFVLGPLDKSAVNILAQSGELTVPVLSLNYADEAVSPPANLFQFGLLPEDEARQVAERAILTGFLDAIAFAPRSDWGERIIGAFEQRFTELGGTVLAAERFTASNTDFSPAIRRALSLNESQGRYSRLRTTLKTDLKFEPRRRQDVDVIFVAASPRQARSLKPQLDFHQAAGIPVYGTSHLYAGIQDPQADRDLNGLTFCDIPWLLEPANPDPGLREQLDAALPQASRQFPRLVALGIDAYRVIPFLGRLSSHPYERYEGVVGRLRVGETGRVHRELNWARFVRGMPELLTTVEPMTTGAEPVDTPQ
jgi:outer membrane PBP1 activator LpoA protein